LGTQRSPDETIWVETVQEVTIEQLATPCMYTYIHGE
jgi:hypothetical protein